MKSRCRCRSSPAYGHPASGRKIAIWLISQNIFAHFAHTTLALAARSCQASWHPDIRRGRHLRYSEILTKNTTWSENLSPTSTRIDKFNAVGWHVELDPHTSRLRHICCRIRWSDHIRHSIQSTLLDLTCRLHGGQL